MRKYHLKQLILTMIFAIAAIILHFFNDPVEGSMMAVAGIAISLNLITQKVMHKDELKKDEMVKKSC